MSTLTSRGKARWLLNLHGMNAHLWKPLILSGVAACFCGWGDSACARIGETILQIEARYGKPVENVSPPSGKLLFLRYHHGNYNVFVAFHDGLCLQEAYQPDTVREIPETDILAFLRANGPDSEWSAFPQPDHRAWLCWNPTTVKNATIVAEAWPKYKDTERPMFALKSSNMADFIPKADASKGF